MHTDTTVTTSTTVLTIADLARALDEHYMALPEGDPGEAQSERACEVVGLLARYVGDQPSSIVADAAGYLDSTRPVGRALVHAPIPARHRSGQSDAGLAVTTLHTQLLLALAAAEREDVDYDCQAHHDVRTLRAWLAEVALALPARTLVAECRTRADAERALRAAMTPFGSLDADMAPMILAADDRIAGSLDALDAALANVDGGEPSAELVIIPHPRSGVGAWGTGVVTPTSGTLILVARSHSGDYRVFVDFRPHPLYERTGAQGRPMRIRGADVGVRWTTIGGAS